MKWGKYKMQEVLLDTVVDSIKLIPFLFITYLIMEFLENRTSDKLKNKIQKSGKFGPLLGGILGIIPQCGFAASSTNLYSAGLISVGTLMAVYLSTSDEMLPIFISQRVGLDIIIKILAIKCIFGVAFGFLIDFIFTKIKVKQHKPVDICEEDQCHCEENGILKASIVHTLHIMIYIFIITLVLNIAIELIGIDTISNFVQANSFLGPIVCSLIGLIPNCAASVILTNLYLSNVINMASLISGLLTGAGVGLIVLFRINKKSIKENLCIMGILYFIGVISGLLLQIPLGTGFFW